MCYRVFSFSFYLSVAGTPVCHSLHMCVKVREQVGVVLSIIPPVGPNRSSVLVASTFTH